MHRSMAMSAEHIAQNMQPFTGHVSEKFSSGTETPKLTNKPPKNLKRIGPWAKLLGEGYMALHFIKIAIQGYGVPYLVEIPSDSWRESFIDRR